ncbi:MAG: hypothetical protein PHE49_04440 [bacterium]|nr:hypothetical protein [bacterium]
MNGNKKREKKYGKKVAKRCKTIQNKSVTDLYNTSEIDEIARNIAMVLRREFLK